jgi:uncharacterized membrane-anchored protein YhcB (DUF1043 family)
MAETKTQSDVDVLESQLQIAEAKIIEQKSTIAGQTAEIAELKKLIAENTKAQEVLSTAAATLSDEIDEKQNKIDVFPDGLTTSEMGASRQTRQEEINELTEKQQKYRAYIRGEL